MYLGYNYNENLDKLKIEAYYNYINDFIAADRNGNTQNVEGEDFNVVVHNQYNALFTGVELSGQYGLTKFNDFDLLANFVGELLKGYRTSNDKARYIPQSKLNVGLQLINEEWDTNIKYYHYFDKEFTGPF